MSKNTHLSIVNSARFLSRVFVGENWVWFLSKNMHGLSAYPTIPFDNSSESISYDIHDLKAFAYLYGRGQRSDDEISSHADEHLKQLALEDLAVGTHTGIVPMGDFMSPYETTDTDYFQLSSGELNALRDRIDLLTNTQSFMIEVLESLAKDILSIGRQGMPTPAEIIEMFQLLDDQVTKADRSHELLAELDKAIADRCERNLNYELDALLGELTAGAA